MLPHAPLPNDPNPYSPIIDPVDDPNLAPAKVETFEIVTINKTTSNKEPDSVPPEIPEPFDPPPPETPGAVPDPQPSSPTQPLPDNPAPQPADPAEPTHPTA